MSDPKKRKRNGRSNIPTSVLRAYRFSVAQLRWLPIGLKKKKEGANPDDAMARADCISRWVLELPATFVAQHALHFLSTPDWMYMEITSENRSWAAP